MSLAEQKNSSKQPISLRKTTTPTRTTTLRQCRSVSPVPRPPTKVSLLQGRLLSKAHSDLQSPSVVQRALLMGNVLRTSSSSKSTSSNKSNSNHKIRTPVTSKKSSSPGPPPPPPSTVTSPSSTTTQVKVQISRSSPVSKIREILTATTKTIPSSSSNNSSSKKSSPNSSSKGSKTGGMEGKGTKSSSSSLPLKPPRNRKEGEKERKDRGEGKERKSGSSRKKSGNGGESRRSPPEVDSVSGGLHQNSITKPPPTANNVTPPPPIPPVSSTPNKMAEKQSPRYTVRERPLAPPAESKRSHCKTHHSSLPSLTPYLGEARRVTDSIFLQAPRPTKTSLMRHIIARDPYSTSPPAIHFRDSTFYSSPSEVTLFTTPPPPPSPHPSHTYSANLQPRQKRRRSVSCLNLRDYHAYVLTLRHTAPRSPRFSRLHSLHSSLERLVELEASSSILPSHLPPSKKHDFEAWSKVRNRARMEKEMESLSRELYTAQRDREFFFRPKTPPVWAPDSHLRFKKWRVEELKAFLTCPDRSRAALWTLDLYKTGWRGVTVKEQALNLEVAELFSKEERPRSPSHGQRSGSLLRRAFSMSSTLSLDQMEGIKRRIGSLITAAKRDEESGGQRKKSRMAGGRSATTTRMGFTLSSLPRTPSPPCKISRNTAGLSESRKKEISHRISEEVKQEVKVRRELDSLRPSLPISTKIALRKAASFSAGKEGGAPPLIKRPIYSIYVNHPVGEKIKAFEGKQKDSSPIPPTFQEIKPNGGTKRRVHILAPNQSGNIPSEENGPASLPLPFRSRSPIGLVLPRSPSPTNRRSLSPTLPPPPRPLSRECVTHINVISKLAELLLRRNSSIKHLVSREVLERKRLERLRSLNSGEVERLRDYFEKCRSCEDLRNSDDVNLLRVLFCSDSNLTKLAESVATTHTARPTLHTMHGHVRPRRPEPGSRSPTPRGNKEMSHLITRCRKPIYQASSNPNVCQPTLTSYRYLGVGESFEGGLDGGGGHNLDQGEWHSLPHPCPPPPPPPIVHTTTRQHLSFTNYDPSIHQPKYRYIPSVRVSKV